MEYTKEELQQHLGDLAMRLAKAQELYKKATGDYREIYSPCKLCSLCA